jgi:CheY-like chemotaxis protein
MARRVLIVDDTAADRTHLARIVADAGHQALLAETGVEAIASARRDRPDVILMDVNMPGIDGFATTRMLKAEPETRDIPVVFVTGKGQKADRAWGQMLGASGYVAKPYQPAEILAEIG